MRGLPHARLNLVLCLPSSQGHTAAREQEQVEACTGTLPVTRQDIIQLSQPAPADQLSSPAYGLVSTV